jgi:ComF family protein
MIAKVGDILNDFLSLVYPSFCEACKQSLVKGEEIICTNCIADLPRLNYHLYKENPLYTKLRGRAPIDFATAFLLFRKKGAVQRLLHSLKYRDRPDIGTKLGRVYAHELMRTKCLSEIDVIVPVPLHESRQRQRGYNQSEYWANGLGEIFSVPVDSTIMERMQRTETQTRRTKLRRWENVQESFTVEFPEKVVGKNVLLVDDIVTTGATLEACAKSLIKSGSKSISLVCIAAAQ